MAFFLVSLVTVALIRNLTRTVPVRAVPSTPSSAVKTVGDGPAFFDVTRMVPSASTVTYSFGRLRLRNRMSRASLDCMSAGSPQGILSSSWTCMCTILIFVHLVSRALTAFLIRAIWRLVRVRFFAALAVATTGVSAATDPPPRWAPGRSPGRAVPRSGWTRCRTRARGRSRPGGDDVDATDRNSSILLSFSSVRAAPVLHQGRRRRLSSVRPAGETRRSDERNLKKRRGTPAGAAGVPQVVVQVQRRATGSALDEDHHPARRDGEGARRPSNEAAAAPGPRSRAGPGAARRRHP